METMTILAFDTPPLVNPFLKMNPQKLLTESELGRAANLPVSALRRILRSGEIAPTATAGSGRLKLYPVDVVREISRLKSIRPLC